MKQTAVECMVEQLTAIGQLEIPKGSNAVTLIIEQAKALEKEQLCYFYVKGAEAEINNPYVTNIEFYNETFKHE